MRENGSKCVGGSFTDVIASRNDDVACADDSREEERRGYKTKKICNNNCALAENEKHENCNCVFTSGI